jgi:chaperonin GroES
MMMPPQQPQPPMPSPQEALPQSAAPDMQQPQEPEVEAPNKEIDKILESANLAVDLDDELLAEIGSTVVEDYLVDEDSRKDWMKQSEEWIKLATQVAETKSYPWPNAANVKYPLVTTSAMQFSARAYPSLIPGLDVVRMRIVGDDAQGQKAGRARRVEKHMSYQLLEEMETWEEDMDKLCMITAIVGCTFKKTFYDSTDEVNKSELVHAKDLVVNYYTTSLETASRKTHLLYKTPNEIKEKQLDKLYLDIELPPTAEINQQFSSTELDKVQKSTPPSVDSSAPRTFLEQHRFWDLDDDGYQEPYVITVDLASRKVVRIVARFSKDAVKMRGTEIIKITPTEYFTMFPFIPNPDGGFYPLGFGALLGPMNETVNTLINQLIDSGTLSNLQAGFLSKGIRMPGGVKGFKPGEWKVVNSTGDDLKKGIFPLPTKEPSTVLFQLLGTIVQSGKELASIAEIFVGKMPGQNTPATTTMATVEQGMKVFTAIYKRLFRALKKEFQKLYRLNGLYLSKEKYFTVLDTGQEMQIAASDYTADPTDIRPAADPQAVSEIQKLSKAQGLLELVQLGTVNPQEVTKRVLEAMQVEDIATLMKVEPKPDPEVAKVQAEMQMKQQEGQMKMQMEQQKAQMQMELKKVELELKKQESQMDLMIKKMEMMMDMQRMQMEMKGQQAQHQMNMQQTSQEHEMNMQLQEDQHHMAKEQAQESHQQKLQQTKETQAAKPKPKDK